MLSREDLTSREIAIIRTIKGMNRMQLDEFLGDIDEA